MSEVNFYALVEGKIPSPFNNPENSPCDTLNLKVVDLGTVRVPSGELEVCDPFVELGRGPVLGIPAGEYPVKVTIADVSMEQDGSHLREAYVSVILANGVSASVEQVSDGEGEECFVGVDAGTVAFVDHVAAQTGVPQEYEELDELFSGDDPNSWFNLMDSPEHYQAGMANIVLPLTSNGENVALSHSGWGDGYYPVKLTRDADGKPLALHIDLEVAVLEDDDDDEDDE